MLLDFSVQIMDLYCHRGSRIVSFQYEELLRRKWGEVIFQPHLVLGIIVHLIVNCPRLATAEDHFLFTCSLVLAIEEQLFLPARSRTARENGVGYQADLAPQKRKGLLQTNLREGTGGGKHRERLCQEIDSEMQEDLQCQLFRFSQQT